MFDDTQKLDLSSKDLSLIEDALHTQQKILSMQSRAGGAEAKSRLTDLKQLLRRLRQQTPEERAENRGGSTVSWSQMARSLFC
ncbi:hypothetical protein [Sulfitobacter sabulilitoris]|uniref:Uncharacterized protein n=1 Tax=Sulfitobacter sabulilitoris TaxID=2562655 RepID=A0A5S3PDD3_9RHOB|nr:hypothetical protein [Sulfitobacter sabulilitoris]TMM51884.1 hypothetical protein FDT80_14200 [Sulfitobacter sabulilitoris]